MKTNLLALAPLTLIAGLAPAAASAEGRDVDQTLTLTGETQEFSKDRGSLRTVTLEYKIELGDTTVVAGGSLGERRVGGFDATSAGFGTTLWHDWSDSVSTRSHAFFSENDPVFARFDLAQDITFDIADKTTLTAGVRYAEYFGGREASFVSLGVRRYFKGGSVAYRLSRVDPTGRDAFLAHLANLTLNDGDGTGKTQLWLSSGAASLARSQFDNNFSGNDRAFLLQRTQPLVGDLALIASAGLSSYANPAGRYTGTNLGLGLALDLD